MSQLKIKDGSSWVNIPASGIGIPSGGNEGQYLKKSSSTDYATEWEDFPSGVVSVYVGDIQNQTNISITADGLYLVLLTANATNGSVTPYFNIKLDGTTIHEAQGNSGGNVTTFKVLTLSSGSTLQVNASNYITNYGFYGKDAIVVLRLA